MNRIFSPLQVTGLVAFSALGAVACATTTRRDNGDATRMAELIAADRAYSDSARGVDAATGMGRMLTDDAWLVGPRLVRGRDSAVAFLRTNTANTTNGVRWFPARAGISADGTHGFTLGYLDVGTGDSVVARAKYLSYWVRRNGQWKVLVYKRNQRPAGPLPTEMMPPSWPIRPLVNVSIVEARESLRAVDVAFSDSAQRNSADAFRYFAAADANLFGPPTSTTYITGPDVIWKAQAAQGNGPAGATWEPSETIIAPSGDLGVNVGPVARVNAPPNAPTFNFMTIWRRQANGLWRYVAE